MLAEYLRRYCGIIAEYAEFLRLSSGAFFLYLPLHRLSKIGGGAFAACRHLNTNFFPSRRRGPNRESPTAIAVLQRSGPTAIAVLQPSGGLFGKRRTTCFIHFYLRSSWPFSSSSQPVPFLDSWNSGAKTSLSPGHATNMCTCWLFYRSYVSSLPWSSAS